MDKFQHFPDHYCVRNLTHPSQAKPGIHPFPARLHVLTMIENPLRWRSRCWNYQAFESQCEAAGVLLYTAEVVLGKRCFELTDPNNPRHLQLRTNHEIWHKENAQNLLMEILPSDAECIACVDADMTFARSDWAQETLHLLQHYQAVQMFTHMVDMGPDYQPYRPSPALGFVYLRQKQETDRSPGDYRARWGCPGGAWAYRRSALNSIGRLLDWLVFGSGDTYMARGLYGEIDDLLRPDFSPVFREFAHAWQEGAMTLKQDIGCMPGTLLHHWHGPKSKRGYEQRPELIAQTKFNPLIDIRRDVQGLYELTGNNGPLRDAMRRIARSRNEDSTESAA